MVVDASQGLEEEPSLYLHSMQCGLEAMLELAWLGSPQQYTGCMVTGMPTCFLMCKTRIVLFNVVFQI